MRDIFTLFLHPIVVVSRLGRPGGFRSVVAESVLLRHQVLILSELVISKVNDLATLAVFTRRAINQEKTIPIRFEDAGIQFGLRRRNDGQVLAEFHHDESMERIPLSALQLYELKILAQFPLHRVFESSGFAAGTPVQPETATALPCLVKVGQGNNGYKNTEQFLPEAAE